MTSRKRKQAAPSKRVSDPYDDILKRNVYLSKQTKLGELPLGRGVGWVMVTMV